MSHNTASIASMFKIRLELARSAFQLNYDRIKICTFVDQKHHFHCLNLKGST